jgi:hypothetical protein
MYKEKIEIYYLNPPVYNYLPKINSFFKSSELRGIIQAKGKGGIEMYFVQG